MLRLILVLVALLAVAAGFVTRSVSADEPETEAALRVERRLVCPTCANLRLDLCELTICLDMRRLINERLAAGDSEDQIVDYFLSRFGERILAAPPRQGLNRLVWGLPVAVAGIGLLATGALLLTWRRRPRTPPEAPVGIEDSEDRGRVRTEIERFFEQGSPWS